MDPEKKAKLVRYLAYFCLVAGGLNIILGLTLVAMGGAGGTAAQFVPGIAGVIAGLVLLRQEEPASD